MIVISRDGSWLERLEDLATKGSWSFEARAALPLAGRTLPPERALVVLDRVLAGAVIGKAIQSLRVLYPTAAVALAIDDVDMSQDTVSAAVSSGADEVLGKSWTDEKIFSRLAVQRDHALAAQALYSADGALKAERRAHRAFVKTRGKWKELPLDAGAFALLWRLLRREGETVERIELGAALAEAVGKERESGTVSRRLAALKKTHAPWKGRIDSARGGRCRLVSSARRKD